MAIALVEQFGLLDRYALDDEQQIINLVTSMTNILLSDPGSIGVEVTDANP